MRWSLSESLTNAGYHVLEAHDRLGTLRFFERVPPGIAAVVLDLRLPDSQDLGLLRRIREAAPDCRVIVMTAYGTPELVDEALKVGAVGVVDKPFDLNRMVDLVRQAIDQRPH